MDRELRLENTQTSSSIRARRNENLRRRLHEYRATGSICKFNVGLIGLDPKDRLIVKSSKRYQQSLAAYLEICCIYVIEKNKSPERLAGYAEIIYARRAICRVVSEILDTTDKQSIQTDPEKVLKYAEGMPKGTIRDGLVRISKAMARGASVQTCLEIIGSNRKYAGATELISTNLSKALISGGSS